MNTEHTGLELLLRAVRRMDAAQKRSIAGGERSDYVLGKLRTMNKIGFTLSSEPEASAYSFDI